MYRPKRDPCRASTAWPCAPISAWPPLPLSSSKARTARRGMRLSAHPSNAWSPARSRVHARRFSPLLLNPLRRHVVGCGQAHVCSPRTQSFADCLERIQRASPLACIMGVCGVHCAHAASSAGRVCAYARGRSTRLTLQMRASQSSGRGSMRANSHLTPGPSPCGCIAERGAQQLLFSPLRMERGRG